MGVGAELQFEADRLSLLERGFVYAIAHVRGGDDLGRGWYLAGHGANKLNSILHYLAVCEDLIPSGHTRAGRIVAHGDSAGGLLVAAAMNRAPDLFLAVIADVAFLDPLNTLLDATLPLTPGEWAELGNPIESPHDFERIRSYSPYETLVPQAYPHVLAKAGLMDQRVMYWEPAKWVAKLRAVTTSERLVMLATSMTGGHDGATSSDDQLADSSFDIAFALKVAGLADAVS